MKFFEVGSFVDCQTVVRSDAGKEVRVFLPGREEVVGAGGRSAAI